MPVQSQGYDSCVPLGGLSVWKFAMKFAILLFNERSRE